MAIAASLPRMGDSRYHGFVVFTTDPWLMIGAVKQPGREISLMFDLFVLNQHVRRLMTAALADADLRADEYAVYGLLFEQAPLTATEMARRMGMPLTTLLDYLSAMDERHHLRREPHPRDGRAQQLSLRMAGITAHRRTNRIWEVMRANLERSLPIPVNDLRRALQGFDDAVIAALAKHEAKAADTG